MAIRNLEISFEKVDSLRVTVSVGISQLRKGENSGQWLERADRALYQAKNQGKDAALADLGDLD